MRALGILVVLVVLAGLPACAARLPPPDIQEHDTELHLLDNDVAAMREQLKDHEARLRALERRPRVFLPTGSAR